MAYLRDKKGMVTHKKDRLQSLGLTPVDSHNPYSRDGEGRKADRQDDPGGHWAGEELPLSQAWGDTGASDRRQRDRETGRGVGDTNTKGNTLGWT